MCAEVTLLALGVYMARRNVALSKRHDAILVKLAAKLDVSLTGAIERGIEALEEKEAQRDVVVGVKHGN